MATKLKNAKLKGHEKFAVREGWITKGLIAIKDNPRLFLDNEGTDLLGVGSNMVKSIRYWLKAFKLIEERQGKGAFLTELGEIIYDYDKYLENIFSLWLLHSQITKNKREATIWSLFFMDCDVDDLTKEEIIILLNKEFENYVGTSDYSHRSLEDDVDVVLKMYTRNDEKDYDPENKNRCPFAELELLKESHGKYTKVSPKLNRLSHWIIIYELSEMFVNAKTISIDDIENKTVGKIYNLSRVNINQYLDRVEQLGYIKVVRTAGLDSVYKTDRMLKPASVLRKYYEDRI